MKKLQFSIIFIILIVSAFNISTQQVIAEDYSCCISGLVIDENYNLVPNATVTLMQTDLYLEPIHPPVPIPDNPRTSGGNSSIPGGFVFTRLAPGMYTLKASIDGYTGTSIFYIWNGTTAVSVRIPEYKSPYGDSLKPAVFDGLTSSDTVFGFVSDMNNNPVGGANVTLRNLDGTIVSIAGNPQVTATEDGRYVSYGSYMFLGVGGGTYRIDVTKDGFTGTAVVTWSGGGALQTRVVIPDYVFIRPPSTPSPSPSPSPSASPVMTIAPAGHNGYTASWVGNVIDFRGMPYIGIPVKLHMMGDEGEISSVSSITANDPYPGSFVIPDVQVPERVKYVYLSSEMNMGPGMSYIGRTRDSIIDDSGTYMSSIMLHQENDAPGAAYVTGRVCDSRGIGYGGATVTLRLFDSGGLPIANYTTMTAATFPYVGSYVFGSIATTNTAYAYVTCDVDIDGQRISGRSDYLKLTAGATTDSAVLVHLPAPGYTIPQLASLSSVTGYATGEDGKAPGGLAVKLHVMDAGGNELYNTSTLTSMGQPFNGSFAFDYLPVGNDVEYAYVTIEGVGENGVKVGGNSARVALSAGRTSTVGVAMKMEAQGVNVLPLFAAVAASTSVGVGSALLNRQGIFQTIFNKIQAFIKSITDRATFVGKIVGFVDGLLRHAFARMISINEIASKGLKASIKSPLFGGISAKDLCVASISAIVLALAFLVARKTVFTIDNILLYIVLAGVITVVHELAHIVVAYRFKATTEYKLWGLGAGMLILTSWLFGTVFAAPARTIINEQAKMDTKNLGLAMLAGPVVSFALSFPFLALISFGGGLSAIGLIGLSMCMLSVVYSMMPFDPMEGKKVYKWNKLVWAAVFIPSFIYYMALLMFVL